MALLNDEIRGQVRELLDAMPDVVRLVFFKLPEDQCEYCGVIEELITELAETSARVVVETHQLDADKDVAESYGIDRAPALAIVGAKDYGLRFFGLPANYEFSTLIHGIQAAGHGAPGQLEESTLSYLASLNAPVHYQVFVTPTCPYCPGAAVLAYDMAVASDWVRAEVVEASEFPEIADRYSVMGVPLNVINETGRVEGRAPQQMIVETIKSVLA
ncbi:MAG: Alkyl hydroperoxide reductase subunit F [Chloroflexi bacterium ADurb.Bin360]|nr:MAG: Alkyl hydroperoxide reductase subunit F [Chloroflexi bacterium ADurb.Bin360]